MLSEEQEEMLSNLNVRLNSQKPVTSLKFLCVRKVAAALPSYAKQRLTKFSSMLPKTLCYLVYQEFLQSCKDDKPGSWMKDWGHCNLKDKVNLFAGNGLEEFDCRILNLDWNHVTFHQQQPFKQLAKESSKLKSFKDTHYNYKNHENFPFKNLLLSEFYSLHFMPNLVVLEIEHFPAKDADLQVIGLNLPLLQRLLLFALMKTGHARNISYEGLEYLSYLKSLKHLTFMVDDTGNYECCVQLTKNCLQLMPQLNTMRAEGYYLVPHEFPSYKDPVELGLENLVVGHDTVIPSNVALHNVTKVFVLYTPLTVSLKQFKNLLHLSYEFDFDEDMSQLDKALSEVGHLLKTLSVSNLNYCDLMHVLQLCPNIEELYLDLVEFYADNFQVSQLKNCVPNLRIFKHELEGNQVRDAYDSRGLLHWLLTSCPKLEELQINALRLTKAEIDLINKEMETGTLAIQRLQKVEINAVLDDEEIACSYADFACKFCVNYCIILKQVVIDEYFDYHRSTQALQLAQAMQNSINCKQKFRIF